MKETLVPSDEYHIRFYCNTKSSKTCWFDSNPREDGTYTEMTLHEAFRYASEERSVKCPHCGSRMQPDSHIRRKEKTRLEALESELWSLSDDDEVEGWLEEYREVRFEEEEGDCDTALKDEEFVFVYGTLKQGFGNHSLLEGSQFLGAGIIKDSNLKLVDLGFCPAVVRTSEEAYDGIAGELYSVSRKTLRRLDILESNGILYTRERFEVAYYCHETEMMREATAWVYLLPESHLEPLTASRVKFVSTGNSFLLKPSSCVNVDEAGIQHWIKQGQDFFEFIEQ